MIKVGIYGASGYMGGEATRILLEHPEKMLEKTLIIKVEIKSATGKKSGY